MLRVSAPNAVTGGLTSIVHRNPKTEVSVADACARHATNAAVLRTSTRHPIYKRAATLRRIRSVRLLPRFLTKASKPMLNKPEPSAPSCSHDSLTSTAQTERQWVWVRVDQEALRNREQVLEKQADWNAGWLLARGGR
jgi:hypothetical protein